jgi:hypothetical protein
MRALSGEFLKEDNLPDQLIVLPEECSGEY